MKITHAEVIVTCPGRNFVTLKIVTDQGVHGLGDATLNGRELSVASYLRDHVCPLLIGRDPRKIEPAFRRGLPGSCQRIHCGRDIETGIRPAAVAPDTAILDVPRRNAVRGEIEGQRHAEVGAILLAPEAAMHHDDDRQRRGGPRRQKQLGPLALVGAIGDAPS